MIEILGELASLIVNAVGDMGYIGIVILMFLESSFFPFPSEIVMIPAGYLAFLGKMDLLLVVFFGILGSVLGAAFNYWLGRYLGRPMLIKYGKYFFLSKERFEFVESKFNENGEMITFIGRLIPGLRQYISFPPGITRMNFAKFMAFTAMGAGIWVSILAILGFYLGKKQHLINEYLRQITIVILALCIALLIIYFVWKKKQRSH